MTKMTKEKCIVCGKETVSVIKTDAGYICYNCYAEQKNPSKRKRKKNPGHRFLKEECQLALLSFSKAGAKVRTLKHNFQIFPEVFFHFSFPRPKFRKKPMAKKRKMEAYRSVLLSECQNIAAFVPESGCKSSAFTDICKIYTSFF